MARKGGKDRGIFIWPAKGEDGRVIYGIRYVDQGGVERKERAGPSKREAQALYCQRKDEIRRGRFRPEDARARRPRLLLQNMIDAYLERMRGLRASWSDQRRFGDMWVARWGTMPAERLTAGDVESLMSEMRAAGYAPATCNRVRAFLHRVYAVALRDGQVEKNPVTLAARLPENNARDRWLTPDELGRLLDVTAGVLRAAIVIAVNTGLRAAEQFSLAWTDVDLVHRVITVRHPKGDRVRKYVPISDDALEALQELPSRLKSAWLFPSRVAGGARPLSRWGMRKPFEAALAIARIEDFCWHDLRHTTCTWLTARGVPPRHIMEIVGHSSMKMTERYSHVARGDLLEAVNRLSIGSQSEIPIAGESRNALQ